MLVPLIHGLVEQNGSFGVGLIRSRRVVIFLIVSVEPVLVEIQPAGVSVHVHVFPSIETR